MSGRNQAPKKGSDHDDAIDAWSSSGHEETRPLHKYLGMTWGEYQTWVYPYPMLPYRMLSWDGGMAPDCL